jgi:membrane associated rhomboid family serine protease
MRMRGSGGGGFGVPGLETTSAKLALGLVAGSVLFLLTRNGQGGLLLLLPAYVFSHLTLWQPFTYGFVETGPLGILFGALIIWSIGGWLEASWGSKRLLLVSVGITALAGFLTALLSYVTPVGLAYPGGTVLTTVLWVAYGLAIGRGQTNFWGMPLSGNMLAAVGAAFVGLNVVTAGWRSEVPALFGLVLIYAYVKGASPRRLWLQLQHWRLQRQLKDRSKHLHVVRPDRSNQDRFLN